MLDAATISANIQGISSTFPRYLTFDGGANGALVVNNAEWLDGLSYLEFLDQVGRHFTVNRLLGLDAIRSRLEHSLSVQEFAYTLLQAHDFTELAKRHGCTLQVGGADQWANIINGIELSRRRGGPALGSHGSAPAQELRGAWAGQSQLGGAAGPAVSNADGSLSQDFEHGRIVKAADGSITVSDAAGEVLETRHAGTASTVEEANQLFVNQEGNTPYYQSFNGAPKPYGPNDCGPTSAVMALAALGLAEHPTAAEAPHAIDAMRDTIFNTNTSASKTMGMSSVQRGLQAYGAETQTLDVSKAKKDGTGLDAIDTALDAGHVVILGGTPGDAWAKDLDKTGDYLDMGASGTASFGHFVAVLGKTDDGKYLLADPLSKQGTIAVSAQQIGTFLKQSGWGEAIEVYPAGKP